MGLRAKLEGVDNAAAEAKLQTALKAAAMGMFSESETGVGVDVEPISTFDNPLPGFLERNFTPAELQYCDSAADKLSSWMIIAVASFVPVSQDFVSIKLAVFVINELID